MFLVHLLVTCWPTAYQQSVSGAFLYNYHSERQKKLQQYNKRLQKFQTSWTKDKTRQDKTTLFNQGSPISCKAGILRGPGFKGVWFSQRALCFWFIC